MLTRSQHFFNFFQDLAVIRSDSNLVFQFSIECDVGCIRTAAFIAFLQTYFTSLGQTSVYHTSGLLAYCEGRYDDAELLLNKAVHEMEKWYGPTYLPIAVILQDLARYHRPSESEANYIVRNEEFYRRVLKIREAKLGKFHLDVSETLVDLGKVLGTTF